MLPVWKEHLSVTASELLKNENVQLLLTLIWVGFLGVRFEVGGGKITPLSKTC